MDRARGAGGEGARRTGTEKGEEEEEGQPGGRKRERNRRRGGPERPPLRRHRSRKERSRAGRGKQHPSSPLGPIWEVGRGRSQF